MNEDPNTPDPARLTAEQLAKLLSAAYREKIAVESIHADVREGAPVHSDGTLSLVQYTAWICASLAR